MLSSTLQTCVLCVAVTQYLLLPVLYAHGVLARTQARNEVKYNTHFTASRRDNGDDGFFNFVTRPDIVAPKWDVKVYDKEAIAPGYWFIAPYGSTASKEEVAGPYIYDGNGQLVWSGAPMFGGTTIFDFRIQRINGEDMMTLIYPKEGSGVILDHEYEIQHKVHVEKKGTTLNLHDFQIVKDSGKGDRALILNHMPEEASKSALEAVDFQGDCKVIFDGFEEFDTKSWDSMSLWSSENNIQLDESTMVKETMTQTCAKDWDFLHANSIDQFWDEDYLLSGRNTNTLYKISKADGAIVWRLGGDDSDFEFYSEFGGQGNARVRGQNRTHLFISVMDNGMMHTGNRLLPTQEKSRALLLELRVDEKPMTAKILEQYNHPKGGHAAGQGNFDVLSNGNAFIGWKDNALMSEHVQNGAMVLQAELMVDLNSYRNYKFEWTGHPKQPPDVHAVADKQTSMTIVYVSWNGATEVATWNVYKTDASGHNPELVASTDRKGFETPLVYGGYASHVFVEARDRNDTVLGKSKVVQSAPASNVLSPDLEELSGSLPMAPDESDNRSPTPGISNSVVAFGGGVVIFVLAILLVRYLFRKKRGILRPRGKTRDYIPVASESEEAEHLVDEDGSEEFEMLDSRQFSKGG